MKRYQVYILAAAALLLLVPDPAEPKPGARKQAKPLRSRNQIAVIKSKYDDVETVLRNYHIPHDLLAYRDLESPDRVSGYRALFVPSGIDNPMEESLDVYASGYRFKSVALKPDFYEVDKDAVARTLRRFVKNGGSVYFSGYSFEYLQRAFDLFEFFDNFPYMGMPARVEAVVRNDLSRFSMKNRMYLYLDHPGWVTIRSARDAETVAFASFETPRGVRSGPITVLARRGGGEILYTSYDSTAFSDFRRFNIYRIAGVHLMKKLESTASMWGQRITGRIVDSIHNGEFTGMHRIDLAAGSNTVYFYSDREFYQIDIVDREQTLIESRDLHQREQTFTIRSSGKDYCYIKLYPSTAVRFGMYAVVSAVGKRIFPYLLYINCWIDTFLTLFFVISYKNIGDDGNDAEKT